MYHFLFRALRHNVFAMNLPKIAKEYSPMNGIRKEESLHIKYTKSISDQLNPLKVQNK